MVRPLVICTEPPLALSELATKFRFNAPTVLVISALMLMLLWAFKLREALLPAVLLIGAATVMSPAWAPPALVARLTLVPASSAVLIVEAAITALSPVVVALGNPLTLLSGPVAFTVRLLGSSSQVPPLPWGAEASGARLTASCCLPEVSTKPPSPPWLPPRALIAPSTRVALSAHTTTWPPLPAWVASAFRVLLPSTVVVVALAPPRLRGLPWTPPPTRTAPPPALPLASTWAAARVTLGAVSSTVPPLAAGPVPVAMIGAALVRLVPACTLTVPPPLAPLTSMGAFCCTVWPWISTRPPGAWMPAACSSTLPPWASSSRP